MNNRKKIHRAIFLLLLLKANNNEPITGMARLKKLLSSIKNEIIKDTPFDDIYYPLNPYNHRLFPSDIFDDVQLMEDMNYIIREELPNGKTKFEITQKGIDKIENIMHKFPKTIRKQLEQIQNEIAIIKDKKEAKP